MIHDTTLYTAQELCYYCTTASVSPPTIEVLCLVFADFTAWWFSVLSCLDYCKLVVN